MHNIYGSVQGGLANRGKTQRFHRTVKLPVELGEMDAMRIIVHLSLHNEATEARDRSIFAKVRESRVEKAHLRAFTDADRSDGPIRRNVFSFGSIPLTGQSRALHSLRWFPHPGLSDLSCRDEGAFAPRCYGSRLIRSNAPEWIS